MKSKVIFVDNEGSYMKFLKRNLFISGIDAEYFTSAKDALHYMHEHQVDIVIGDSHLDSPGMDSFAFFKAVQENYPDVYRVMLGDCEEDIKVKLALVTRTVEQCFSKSWDVAALLAYLKMFGNNPAYSTVETRTGGTFVVSA